MHKSYKIFSNMPCFTLQNATFYNTKDRLSHGKRRPFGNELIFSGIIINAPYHNISTI